MKRCSVPDARGDTAIKASNDCSGPESRWQCVNRSARTAHRARDPLKPRVKSPRICSDRAEHPTHLRMNTFTMCLTLIQEITHEDL